MESNYELLNSENCFTWADNMKVLLMEKGSWSFIDGTEPPIDEKASRKETRDYKLRKDRAYSTIFLGVEQDFRTLISGTTDGREAWDILKKHFRPVSRARIVQLLDEFFEARYTPGESVGIYAAKLRRIVNQLKDCNHPLEEVYQAFQLIRYMPAEFQGGC